MKLIVGFIATFIVLLLLILTFLLIDTQSDVEGGVIIDDSSLIINCQDDFSCLIESIAESCGPVKGFLTIELNRVRDGQRIIDSQSLLVEPLNEGCLVTYTQIEYEIVLAEELLNVLTEEQRQSSLNHISQIRSEKIGTKTVCEYESSAMLLEHLNQLQHSGESLIFGNCG